MKRTTLAILKSPASLAYKQRYGREISPEVCILDLGRRDQSVKSLRWGWRSGIQKLDQTIAVRGHGSARFLPPRSQGVVNLDSIDCSGEDFLPVKPCGAHFAYHDLSGWEAGCRGRSRLGFR